MIEVLRTGPLTIMDIIAKVAELDDFDTALDTMAARMGCEAHNNARLVLSDLSQSAWFRMTYDRRERVLAEYVSIAVLNLTRR